MERGEGVGKRGKEGAGRGGAGREGEGEGEGEGERREKETFIPCLVASPNPAQAAKKTTIGAGIMNDNNNNI